MKLLNEILKSLGRDGYKGYGYVGRLTYFPDVRRRWSVEEHLR
ncbi:MAG: hypothetical protein O4751_00495 [Trichodesmium sp. St2_bin6]|nr:hypothetical protein [Trichodesmium sp. St5_bin8]MDE5076810.1 hypothetical protein [Trichodesmium sp. St2_bin6]MDE5103209.1 hypothetical protein [Trichodesmium sp. St19_bin2]